MKNSIVGKTLIILSSVIIVLFVLVAYLFIQSDNILIEKIRIYNYNNTMKTLDDMKMQQLQESKQNIQTTISSIAKNSSIFVYNYDKDGLENSIKNFMKKDGLKCIEIWEGSTNKLFLSVLKNDKQIIISKISPKESIKYQKLHESMFVNESNSKLYIGKVVVYYDEAIIRNRIKALKDKALPLRRIAAISLSKLGSGAKAALNSLREAEKSKDYSLRVWAKKAIQSIEGKTDVKKEK